MSKAIDHFWMFGVRPHQDDIWVSHDYPTALGGSRITPAEGAHMLGLRNAIMVQADGEPAPFSNPARQYCESFRGLDRLLWSCVGSGGFRFGNEEAYIVELAGKYPYLKGAFCDDIFGKFSAFSGEERLRRFHELLRTIRDGLDRAPRRLPLYAVWYHRDTGKIDPALTDYFDGLTYWTWNSEELPQLPARFEALEASFPRHKKLLGLYLYDFYHRRVISDELMLLQCDFGLEMMRQGRLDGLIFESNAELGLGYESETFAREWIAAHRDDEMPDSIGFDR